MVFIEMGIIVFFIGRRPRCFSALNISAWKNSRVNPPVHIKNIFHKKKKSYDKFLLCVSVDVASWGFVSCKASYIFQWYHFWVHVAHSLI